MATLKTTIKTPSVVRTIVRGMGRPGTGGLDWQAIYARTTDPAIAGEPWNNGGFLVFSSGVFTASLDFSNASNSMYLALFIEEF